MAKGEAGALVVRKPKRGYGHPFDDSQHQDQIIREEGVGIIITKKKSTMSLIIKVTCPHQLWVWGCGGHGKVGQSYPKITRID